MDDDAVFAATLTKEYVSWSAASVSTDEDDRAIPNQKRWELQSLSIPNIENQAAALFKEWERGWEGERMQLL